jgi:cysteine desulfurase/selenocysteine lyase
LRLRQGSELLPDLRVRGDFPLLAGDPGLHYLDSAATSQKPKVVLDAIRDFYETANANPHRGAYSLSVRATERYHDARTRIARFLGVADSDCLIFTRGTTEGLNLVASSWGMANVSSGDEIVVTAMDHHANFVPWQILATRMRAKFRICELTPDGKIDLDALSELLNERTKIVAFSHVSNALGTINPVAEIVRLVRAKSDAILVCDGAQSAPHFPVSFDSLGVDFYAFSGHKMLGPMGIGGLIGKRATLEEMPPYQTGGDMIEFVYDDRTTWNVLPHKFEAGTPNAADAVGLAAAVGYLEKLGMDRVIAHERALTAVAQQRLEAIGGLRIYGPAASERSGVVSFTLDDVHPHDLATILDGEGVCIRAGHHCAQPLMRRLDVPATARASFYVYNDESDIDALVAGIMKAREIFARVPA